jgi:hypothetical protein
MLIHRNAGGLGDLRPARDVVAQESRELIGRVARRVGARLRHPHRQAVIPLKPLDDEE